MERLARLGRLARIELHERIVPFWLDLIDLDHGGFVGAAFSRSRLIRDAEKSCVLQCRILWFFSTAHSRTGDPAMLAAARHAFDFIVAWFFDPGDDGVFWSVQADGRPADTQKHVYAQSFAIFGLAAFYRACGSLQALDLAKRLHGALETAPRTVFLADTTRPSRGTGRWPRTTDSAGPTRRRRSIRICTLPRLVSASGKCGPTRD